MIVRNQKNFPKIIHNRVYDYLKIKKSLARVVSHVTVIGFENAPFNLPFAVYLVIFSMITHYVVTKLILYEP